MTLMRMIKEMQPGEKEKRERKRNGEKEMERKR